MNLLPEHDRAHDPLDRTRDRFGEVVGSIVRTILRAPWAVVLVCLAVTAGLGLFTLRNISVNTDTTEMLSPDLAFRRDFDAYRRAFPTLSDNLVIVIEAENPDRAEDGAAALYQRLQQHRNYFRYILYPEGDPFFLQNGLLYLDVNDLQALAMRLSEAQPLLSTLSRDPTMRGLFEVLGAALDALGTSDGQQAQIAGVLDLISTVAEARADGKPHSVSWKKLMAGETAPDGPYRVIVTQPKLSYDSLAPATSIINEIRRYARDLGLSPENGVRVRITGTAAIDSEEIESVTRNTQLAGQISFLVVTVLLVVCFRSLRLVVASLIVLAVGFVWTGAFAVAAVGSFNLVSVGFAVLFIGVGADFGIHVSLRYREMANRGHAGGTALVAAGKSIGMALGLMAASLAFGFFSFLPTDYRGASELGLIAGFGMIVAFVTNITFLPALLAIWPPRPAATARELRGLKRIEDSEHWLWRHSRGIVLAATAVGLASLLALWGARFDRNPLNLKDASVESVATAIDLLKIPRLRVGTISILVDSPDEIGPLSAKLKKLPSVQSVRSIFDYVPRNQAAKLEILEDIALQMTPILAPTTRAAPTDSEQRKSAIIALQRTIERALDQKRAGPLAAQLRRLHAALGVVLAGGADGFKTAELERDLLGSFPKRLDALKTALAAGPVELSSLPGALRQREMSSAGKIRVQVVPNEDLRDNQALRRFVDEVRSVAPHATAGPVIELLAGNAIIRAFTVASVIAFVLIVSGLLLVLRNAVDVLLILAPLLLASAVTVGFAVAVGLSFNFANIIVLPLLIGLGVSSGIHLVIRARRETTIKLLRTTTPRAVLFSALTTIASFASLAVSSHWGQASMGVLLLIAITVNLVCYLVVLPALLSYVEQWRLARTIRRHRDRSVIS